MKITTLLFLQVLIRTTDASLVELKMDSKFTIVLLLRMLIIEVR